MSDTGYVSSDYLRIAAQRAEAFKLRTYEMLQLQPDARVLDVGCGPGLDTCALAERLGSAGRVVGVDVDAAMVAEADALARARHCAGRVEHQVGDVAGLPFADGAFTAVRAERLLQVLSPEFEPAVVVRELWRLVAAGGVLLLADADWGSASVAFDDAGLERRLMAFFASSMRPNGFAGRQLQQLLLDVGVVEFELEVVAIVHRDTSLLPFGERLVERAQAAGIISADEGVCWLQGMEQRVQAGRFFATVNMLIASGRKQALA